MHLNLVRISDSLHLPTKIMTTPREPLKSFFENRLGLKTWSKIEELFDAIESGHRKILVRSCNGAGKTVALAAICHWKLLYFEDSIVLTTSSCWRQVENGLWGDIRKQAAAANLYPDTKILQTRIPIDDKHYAIGLSPDRSENAQGFHAPSMLIAVDEATSASHDIMDAFMGNATSEDSQIILICNPISTQCYAYEAEQSGQWHVISISAMEHPNVMTGELYMPGAVTRAWIEDRLRSWSYETDPDESGSLYIPWLDKWFRKTPHVLTRIMGEWADTDIDGFIIQDVIDRSLASTPNVGDGSLEVLKAIGVDVARNGNDETVIAFFRGDEQLPFETARGRDLMKTAARIHTLFDDGWTCIAVDDTGIGGGVCDRLKELKVPHYAVSFAHKPRGFTKKQKEVANARAEMYFLLEEEMREERIKILADKQLNQELLAPRLAISEQSQLYRLEEKENIRRRLGRSPDRADATALARYGVRLRAFGEKPRFF